MFGAPEFGYDGWQYISSGKSILTGTMPENYFWVRQPLWPLLLAVPIYFGANVWFVVLLSCILISLGWSVFVLTVRGSIGSNVPAKSFWLAALIPAVGLWLYLGGYVTTPLQQAALVGYLLLLSSLSIVTFSATFDSNSKLKIAIYAFAWLFMTSAGYLLTSVYGLIAVGCAFVIAVMRLSKSRVLRLKNLYSMFFVILLILGSAAGLVASHLAWNSVVSNAISSPDFNEENTLDPFWKIDYVGNIRERVYQRTTYYAQEVFVSVFSLLDITQSRGWRGIDNNPFRDDEVNINFAIGSRPFTDTVSACAESLPWEYVQTSSDAMPTQPKIITVDPEFVSEFQNSPQCKLTTQTLPQWFSLLGWVMWISLLGVAILGLIRKPSRLKFALLTPPIILILAYGVTGGAIARYGIPAYYPIALLGALTLIEFLAGRRKSGEEDDVDKHSIDQGT
ncbi:hypothetical protein [Arsukibacterium sp.]|uniref:hypothetical protein n=1 Tax=Arsukibacterium sp. TaxID=1977258 RepID=UPI001BD35284|nr:hypothetical protein [Arsukibacterium sp.]